MRIFIFPPERSGVQGASSALTSFFNSNQWNNNTTVHIVHWVEWCQFLLSNLLETHLNETLLTRVPPGTGQEWTCNGTCPNERFESDGFVSVDISQQMRCARSRGDAADCEHLIFLTSLFEALVASYFCNLECRKSWLL